MEAITIIGISASACTAVSLLPQLIKTIKTKKPTDVSLWVMIILITGVILWVIYGSMLKDMIIVISNAISLLINSLLLALHIIYKKRENNSSNN